MNVETEPARSGESCHSGWLAVVDETLPEEITRRIDRNCEAMEGHAERRGPSTIGRSRFSCEAASREP